jgi:hypothetical protein
VFVAAHATSPQGGLLRKLYDIEGGYGFLIEAAGAFPAFTSPAFPWRSGEQHKRLMSTLRWMAPFIIVARDHGSGEVVLDDLARPVVRWGLDDEVDARLAVRAHVELARLHHAGGAAEIVTAHAHEQRWRRGEPFEDFLAGLEQASYAPNDVACFTALDVVQLAAAVGDGGRGIGAHPAGAHLVRAPPAQSLAENVSVKDRPKPR